MPLSGSEPRTLRLEVLYVTTRLKLQNGILQNIQMEITQKTIFFIFIRYRQFSVYKNRRFADFLVYTGDKTECPSPMMFSNYYIT